jgi:hypothetical protein
VNLIIEPVKQTNQIIQKPIIEQTKPKETQKITEKQSNLIPIGIIGAGSILLYLGLKNPVNTQLFNAANKKIFSMERKTLKYIDFVKETITKTFADIPELLKNLKDSKQIDLKTIQEEIKKAKSPKEILSIQEKTFNNINQKNHQGKQEVDSIKIELEKRRRAVWETVKSERNKNQTVFTELANIPPFEDGSNQKLVDKYNKILSDKKEENIKQMNQFTDNESDFYKKFYAKEMAEIITDSRENKNLAKENVLQNTFKKVKILLQIDEDFTPSYLKNLNLDNFSKLTPEELKPQILPKEITKSLEHTPFTDTILNKDFNAIKEEDLKIIFYKMQENNSLKDLRYLIDKFRLEKTILKAEKSELTTHYEVLIPKLEYLSVKLKDFGEKEIINKLNKDFSKMTNEEKSAALYYVDAISKKLGFSNINAMDQKLYRSNQNYSKLKLKELMLEVKLNPDLYFF